MNLKIEKVKESRINQIDFSKLSFGKTFADHMFICEYTDGQWQNPTIKPYAPITLEPSASVFHYGQAVVEGMKAYKDDKKITNVSINLAHDWQCLSSLKNGLIKHFALL